MEVIDWNKRELEKNGITPQKQIGVIS